MSLEFLSYQFRDNLESCFQLLYDKHMGLITGCEFSNTNKEDLVFIAQHDHKRQRRDAGECIEGECIKEYQNKNKRKSVSKKSGKNRISPDPGPGKGAVNRLDRFIIEQTIRNR